MNSIEKLLKEYISSYRNKTNQEIIYDNEDIFKFEHYKKWINNKTKNIDPESEFIRIGLENYNLEDNIIYDIKKLPNAITKIDYENNTCRSVYKIITKQVSYLEGEGEGEHKLLNLFSKDFSKLIEEINNKNYDFGSIHILACKHEFEDDKEFPNIVFEWYEIYFYDLDEGIYTPTLVA